MPVRLCLSSGKGGVGKTSLAVNVALALAGLGRQVLLVDGDLGLANVDVHLGLTVTRSIHDVLEAGHDPWEALLFLETGLAVLPAGSGVAHLATPTAEDQALLARALDGLAARFDLVLVDAAAGLGPSVLWFNAWADHSLVVVTPDPTSMTDAYALIKLLSLSQHRRSFHLILNQAANEEEGRTVFHTLAQVSSRFLQVCLHHLATVPLDPAVKRALREQVPLFQAYPQAKASQAVAELARRIHGRQEFRLPGNAALSSSTRPPRPAHLT